MSETKWTPGPWEAADRIVVVTQATHGYSTHIADFARGGARSDTQTANCILAAAAPELYEALDSLATHVGKLRADVQDMLGKQILGDLMEAQIALAKARGESQEPPMTPAKRKRTEGKRVKKRSAKAKYSNEPQMIDDATWFYETGKGLLVVHECRDNALRYLRTDQFVIPWQRIMASAAKHPGYRVERVTISTEAGK